MSTSGASGIAARIGANIRTARLERRMTQSELAAALGATSLMAVSRWERGEHKPSDEFLVKLAVLFDRDPAWFYEDHDGADRREAA